MTAYNVQKPFSSSVSSFDFAMTPQLSKASLRDEPRLAQIIPFPVHQSTGVSAPSNLIKGELNRLVEALGPELARLLSIALIDAAAKVVADAAANSPRRHDPAVAHKELQRELQMRFDAEQIEDGLTHPAERPVSEVLQKYPEAKEWLWQLLSDPRYKYRIELLRCVGRMPSQLVGDWGIWVASQMLQSENIEVRDAAICALELWGTEAAAEALRAHREPVPWLADYVASLLKAL
jgi:hypothetical protein